jgi:hypothetical protein
VKRRYFAQIRKLLLEGNSAMVLVQLGPSDCLNFRVLQYYFPNVPVYATLGLRDPIPGFRRVLSTPHGNPASTARASEEGREGEHSPVLAVGRDHVLLLHLRSVYVEVNVRGESERQLVTEDQGDPLDIYRIYVLSLSPRSSVDVTSGRRTISIVE